MSKKPTRQESSLEPKVSRRAANIEGRRRRILEGARTLLNEGGPEGLSMRKLAREAELSVTTLYNLFGSREEILQALVDDSARRFQAPAEPPDSETDPLSRVIRRFERTVLLFPENAGLAKPLIVAKFGTGFWSELALQLESWAELKTRVHEAFVDALHHGDLTRTINPGLAESQLYVGFQFALDNWAFGRVDDEELLDLSLCGAYITLLAIAAPHARAELEKRLRKVERRIRRQSGPYPHLPPSAYRKRR